MCIDTMYLDIGEPGDRLAAHPYLAGADPPDGRGGSRRTCYIHAVMPGKCLRLDTAGASHLPVFNQIEGLVVDRGITFGDLAGTIETFTQAYFGGGHAGSCLRPAYFPFTRALG